MDSKEYYMISAMGGVCSIDFSWDRIASVVGVRSMYGVMEGKALLGPLPLEIVGSVSITLCVGCHGLSSLMKRQENIY